MKYRLSADHIWLVRHKPRIPRQELARICRVSVEHIHRIQAGKAYASLGPPPAGWNPARAQARIAAGRPILPAPELRNLLK